MPSMIASKPQTPAPSSRGKEEQRHAPEKHPKSAIYGPLGERSTNPRATNLPRIVGCPELPLLRESPSPHASSAESAG